MKYESWNKTRFLLEMKPLKSLGGYDDDGHAVDPVLTLGPVVKKGFDLPSGRNHADYIDGKDYYDIVQYNLDHEEEFPGCCTIIVGQLSPHRTTEVDCESLFSQVGHQSRSSPNRNRQVAELFERLVMGKHRLSHIYCCKKKVLTEFLRRWKTKSWSEDDDRDNFEFWERQQKNESLKQNPNHGALFDEEDEVDDVDVGGEATTV